MREATLTNKQILLIGAGSMATAMIRGLLTGGSVRPPQITVTNRQDRAKLHLLERQYAVQVVEDLWQQPERIRQADVIVLACKPHDVAEVVERLQPHLQQAVLLSVAAGISTRMIESIAGPATEVVRAMPNTACAVLESATAVCFGVACTEQTRALAQTMLSVLGTVSVVSEEAMDAVTGVSGSGPAYFYYMVEAMQQAAEALGLEAQVARTLVLQTLCGAGRMMQETGLGASELRQQVTSPNGTTMAGLRVMEETQFPALMQAAIARATERSRQLGVEQVAVIAKRNRTC